MFFLNRLLTVVLLFTVVILLRKTAVLPSIFHKLYTHDMLLMREDFMCFSLRHYQVSVSK